MSKCSTCIFRGGLNIAATNAERPGCSYILHTGRSRLAEVYRSLGVKRMTDAVREAMKPAHCRHYVPGTKIPEDGEKRIVLPGSPVGRGKENRPPRASAPTGSPTEKNGPQRAKAPAAKAAAPAKPRKPRASAWDKDAALELWKQGLLDPQIGERLGVSSSTIERWRHEKHLTSNYARSPRSSQLLALWRQGKCDSEIAEELGMKRRKVQDWRNGRRLKRNPSPGEREQAAAMARRRALYDEGKTDREIAEALGIQARTVTVWRWHLGLPANVREKR